MNAKTKGATNRRSDFQHAITYNGQALKGLVHITRKIDGVRLLHRGGKVVTRNDKVPLGINALTQEAIDKLKLFGDAECYLQDFATTQSALGTIEPLLELGASTIYPLTEFIDGRLLLDSVKNPTAQDIKPYLEEVLEQGYEGLVLRHVDSGNWYRVKPYYTADVIVTGVFEQEDNSGFNKNTLGGFTTNYGNVTAFSDFQRNTYWQLYKEFGVKYFENKLVEVEYKELYPSGNFRYAVTFKRFRTDKSEESFDTKPKLKGADTMDLASLLNN